MDSDKRKSTFFFHDKIVRKTEQKDACPLSSKPVSIVFEVLWTDFLLWDYRLNF